MGVSQPSLKSFIDNYFLCDIHYLYLHLLTHSLLEIFAEKRVLKLVE